MAAHWRLLASGPTRSPPCRHWRCAWPSAPSPPSPPPTTPPPPIWTPTSTRSRRSATTTARPSPPSSKSGPPASPGADAVIEFFFDCSSPWTYLAFTNIQPMAAELGAEIVWRPILVGGIFNTINPSVYQSREAPVPAKARYSGKDLQDWARSAGLKIKMPPSVFPVNSVKVMRACIVLAPRGRLVDFARAAFEVYWGEDRDISQHAVIADICARAGVEAEPLFAAISQQEIKDALKANTDELMRRGGFGSPTIFLNGDDMYFGNDRLPLVREALARAG